MTERGPFSKPLIGLVGGMSWHSTARYYRMLNEASETRRGAKSTLESLVYTLDFAPLFQLASAGKWDGVGHHLWRAAEGLEEGGASCVALTAVTAHRVFDVLAKQVRVPCLHVLDPVGPFLKQRGCRRVGVLATGFAAGQDFFDDHLARAGVGAVLRPDAADQAVIDDIIENQLTRGMVTAAARQAIDAVGERLRQRGADAILLACTELPLLYQDGAAPADVVDAVALHVNALLDHAEQMP
ncbi:aspartate/glutamate racemase family protein [Phreatobacter stygius]|uniref:Amino acid racemase n=1 Tax=Phreatobacter stygius TaxID=1940610 RepID=A0A4D7AUZ7_9HYPH|nr:amino acid racemase [Phreatobacter stygius]QCI64729.1 amino acid racemase [Phreatobacter stygius]